MLRLANKLYDFEESKENYRQNSSPVIKVNDLIKDEIMQHDQVME